LEPFDSPMDLTSNFPVSSYRKWVECRIEDAEKKSIALDAVESFEQLINKDNIQGNELSPLLIAVQHSSTVVADVGALCLTALAKKHDVVFDLLRKLLISKKLNERLVVIHYLRSDFPRDFLLEVVSQGLTDKSYQIRCNAADACSGLGLTELISLLEEKLLIEKNSYALEGMKHAIGLLKDGYYLHYSEGGHPWLTVRKTSGERLTVGLKQGQIDKEGLSSIVERVKTTI
jgi:hypothetical protein